MPKEKGLTPIAILVIIGIVIIVIFVINNLNKPKQETASLQPTSTTPSPTSKPGTPSATPKNAKITPSPTNKPGSSNSPTVTSAPSNSSTSTPTPTTASTNSTSATATPTSTPTPVLADSCSGVSVSGATYVSSYQSQNGTYYMYRINAGSTATLTAQISPTNGYVNWKIASKSSNLPSGGSFSSNGSSVTNWTAPSNPSTDEEGVDVRGDISESPNPWKYCPTITFAVRPG